MIHTPLLSMEQGLILRYLTGINTITFFNGDIEQAKNYLQLRVSKILKANPWLAGHLIKNNGTLELVYPKAIDIEASIQKCFLTIKAPPKNSSYTKLGEHFNNYVIKDAQKASNTKAPLMQLVITPLEESNNNSFILFFSLSHTIADGHTYYQILNMLSSDHDIIGLNVKRKHELSPMMKEAIGIQNHNYLFGYTHILNALKSSLSLQKTKCFAFYLDTKKIKEQKALHKTPAISTNDIFVSYFTKLTNIDLNTMAINFRDKLPNLAQTDAGNYESILCFDNKNLQASDVRKTLIKGTPYQSFSHQLPHFLKGVFCKMGLITNWSQFSKELNIDGAKEELHLPLTYTSFPYELAIIFRAKAEKKGVLFISKTLKSRDFEDFDSLLRESISKEIFI
jgi:hypothetical protein